MRWVVVLAAALVLTGCAARIEARQHAQCVDSGYDPGTEGYLACRQFLENKRQANMSASLGLMSLGYGMANQQPRYVVPPPTIYNIRGRTYSCSQFGNFVTCN